MEKQQNKTPEVRFPEFKNDWEFIHGNELFERISNKNHNSDLPILAISQEFGAIPRHLINYKISVTEKSVSSYKVVEKGDFIISLRSFQGGIEYSNYKGICSPAYIILRPTIELEADFFKSHFKSFNYIQQLQSKLEGIRDGKMISYKYFSEIKLPFPTLPEQQKIARFFSITDKKLTQLQEKKTALELYKKGMMQQIFSQKIRFKDDNGNDYPEWEVKKLGEVGKALIGLTYSPNDVVVSDGTLVLRSSNVQDKRLAFEDNVYVKGEISEKNFVKENDILVCARNGSRSLIGKSALITKEYENCAFGAFMSIYRSDFNKFFFHVFQTEIFDKQITQHLGATINQITNKSLISFKFPVPCTEEQTKIANFLSKIDAKINTVTEKIEQTKAYKKGLLQKMFCN